MALTLNKEVEAEVKTPRRRKLLIALAVLVAVLAGYTVWSNVRPVTISASTEIQATPEEVWQVLTAFDQYAEWNPFMTSAQVTSAGQTAKKGAHLKVVMRDASGDSTFKPEILTYQPGEELRWLGRMGPGWIADGEHRFIIEQTGPGTVRLTQRERFTGVAVPFAQGYLKDNTLPQFHAMNRAVAERVAALRK
jgi:hypothetical protein